MGRSFILFFWVLFFSFCGLSAPSENFPAPAQGRNSICIASEGGLYEQMIIFIFNAEQNGSDTWVAAVGGGDVLEEKNRRWWARRKGVNPAAR